MTPSTDDPWRPPEAATATEAPEPRTPLWSALLWHGRIGRATWWMAQILVVGVTTAGLLAWSAMFPAPPTFEVESAVPNPTFTIGWMLAGATLSFWISAKRVQDLGYPGATALLVLVPYVGPLGNLAFCGFRAGEDKDNRWGAVPTWSDPLGLRLTPAVLEAREDTVHDSLLED